MSAFIIEVSADARTLHRTEALLREHGYSVGIASSFVEGLALLDSVMADLLVADLRLNDYNGLELATQIHLDHPEQMRPSLMSLHRLQDWRVREVLQRTLQGGGGHKQTALRLPASAVPAGVIASSLPGNPCRNS